MRIVILSGYSEEDFDKAVKHGGQPGCYICKRRPGDKGVYAVMEEDNKGVGSCELEFTFFEIAKGNTVFRYPVCHECHSLVHDKQALKMSSQEVDLSDKINLN